MKMIIGLIALILAVTGCKGSNNAAPTPAIPEGYGLVSGSVSPYEASSFNAASMTAVHVRFISPVDQTVVAETDSDSDFKYSITIAAGNYIIEFSRIGYRVKQMPISVAVGVNPEVHGRLLSRPSSVTGTSVGTKMLFAGIEYVYPNFQNANVEVYDVATGAFSVHELAEIRGYPAPMTIGDKVYFIGGMIDGNGHGSTMIDIYDSTNDSWSTQTLQVGRVTDQVAAIGNKLIVVGGSNGGASALDTMEIIDTDNGQKSIKTLSVGRDSAGLTVVGQKAYITGGRSCWTLSCTSQTMDIYDASNDSLATGTIPSKRMLHQARAIGTKIYLVGGANDEYEDMEIYDTSNDSWSSIPLAHPSGTAMSAVVIGQKLYIAGGMPTGGGFIDKLSIYDSSNDSWTSRDMVVGRYNMAVAVINGKIYLAGGAVAPAGETDLIEVIDTSADTISIFSDAWL